MEKILTFDCKYADGVKKRTHTEGSGLHLETKGNHGICDREGEASIHLYGERPVGPAGRQAALDQPVVRDLGKGWGKPEGWCGRWECGAVQARPKSLRWQYCCCCYYYYYYCYLYYCCSYYCYCYCYYYYYYYCCCYYYYCCCCCCYYYYYYYYCYYYKYQAVPPVKTQTEPASGTEGPECSRNFTSSKGVIKTPGFPDKYPNNLDCTFMIIAPKMSEIVVDFDAFDMEPDTTPPPGALCRYDWLEIWDGFPADFKCVEGLGMESGEITSDQITASSQYNPNWSPERSRLNYKENGWTPSEDSSREGVLDSVLGCLGTKYLVDLGFLRFVSAVGTQGAISKETKKEYFVRSYKVDVSSNGEDWIFQGNHNPTDEARLLTGRSGWTQQQTRQPFRNEWLQVDLGQDKLVSGLVIQGGHHRDKNVFMKRFKVGYSNNGSDWTMVNEDNGAKPKIFIGNQNHDTPELRTLGHLLTRFLRPTTLPPTTPVAITFAVTTFAATMTASVTTPAPTSEECDDEQASCHSGTGTGGGEDYDTTGDTTVADPIMEGDRVPEYLWFACDFGWADNPSFCGWTLETDAGPGWMIQTSGAPTVHKGPNLGHTACLLLPSKGGPGNFIYMQLAAETERKEEEAEEERMEERVARLTSLPVTAPDTDLCVSFWYHMLGEHAGTLHIKQRRETEEGRAEALLWTVSGHQGSRWREGRILDGLTPEEYPDIPEAPTSQPTEICIYPIDPYYPEVVENSELGDPGNMLKTLDPILITIIAMSALGVFLGAICGVVLYCACSHGHMSDSRNLSALENYNFELVDGVKLKKDSKLNAQNSYSEA
ncbi:unnamed protein product [Coregonus sp. 'balchen']|nr:unnamed protein product [Coregonus sp. 'balchen']